MSRYTETVLDILDPALRAQGRVDAAAGATRGYLGDGTVGKYASLAVRGAATLALVTPALVVSALRVPGALRRHPAPAPAHKPG